MLSEILPFVKLRPSQNVSTTAVPSFDKCAFLTVLPVTNSTPIVATAIATSVINLIVAVVATVGNILTIILLIKYRRLRTASNMLIASLCVSDLIVGAVVLPFSCVRRTLEMYDHHNCITRMIFAYTGFVCVVVSLGSVAMISADRCLAIKLPFRYQGLATTNRYGVSVLLLWLLMVGLTMLPFLGLLTMSQYFFCIVAILASSTLAIIICYSVIYASTHRQKTQMQVQRTAVGATSHHSRRRVNTSALIVGVLLLCYAPQMVVLTLRSYFGDNEILVYIVDAWVDLIVFLNSALNPIIYARRMPEFKLAFLNLIGKDGRIRSQTYMDAYTTNVARDTLPRSAGTSCNSINTLVHKVV